MPDQDPLTRPLADLLADAEIDGDADDRPIAGVTADSREVRRGSLFVAISGVTEDGHRFAREAVESGAVAVVCERGLSGLDVPVIEVDDARRALASLADAWYDHPSERLQIVGITGSMGKTSVLTFLEGILEEAGVRVGAIGSEIVGMRVHDRFDVATPNTTPDPVTLHRGLRVMADSGARVAAMEVSSHAIDQERVHGLRFSVGIFTNLAPLEHQDYHGSFDEYVAVKCRFFDSVGERAPLIVGADSARLLHEVEACGHEAIRCGFASDADVRITDTVLSSRGTSCVLEVTRPLRRVDGSTLQPVSIPLEMRLMGRPHLLNAAFAVSAALLLTDDVDAVQRGLAAIAPPHRRMELLEIGDRLVLDDTAGHPASLEAVFDVARRLPRRDLHVVAAIRGMRGAEINAELANALRHHCDDLDVASLTVTSSEDVVDEADAVTDDEQRAFMQALGDCAVTPEYHERLGEALSKVAQRSGAGDLIVLVGAQGMRPGADLLRESLEPEPETTVKAELQS